MNKILYSKIHLLVITLLFCSFSSMLPAQVVYKQLYLSNPGQSLDRIDPVATADGTTSSTPNLSLTPPGVAHVNTTTAQSNNPGSSTITVPYTTGSGFARLMLVGVSQKNKFVYSVTYGGTPLTFVGEETANGNARVHLYALVNPPTGTANVVVELSDNPDKGIVVGVSTFTGVNQTTPLGIFSSNEAKTNYANVNVSSATGELVYDVVSFRNATITANGGQSVLYNINTGGEIDGGGGSTKSGAPSVLMSWNGSSSQDWAMGAVSIKPNTALTTTSFTQSPSLCSPLTIKAGNTISVSNYVTIINGTMPSNPNITATIKYGSTNIITLTNPTFNSATGEIVWSGTRPTDITVPAGAAIVLEISTAQSGVTFRIDYDSQTKPSKINLPVSTYINVNSVNVYDAAYPSGNIITGTVGGATRYIRAVVSDPFGNADITAANISITPPGTSVVPTQVAASGCIKTYEYVWPTPTTQGLVTLSATAKEGYENTVTHTANSIFDICTECPPSAINDIASGPGGVPVNINVLANDSDPNNNINTSSLTIQTQPKNGTALISNGRIVYIPNGTFAGKDTLEYSICDLSSPTPLCATALVIVTIDATIVDPCLQVAKQHTYYIPYDEQNAYTALVASSDQSIPSSNLRTVMSIKIPYPGMLVTWDEWEDGYESNINNPIQSTTKVWGDGNIFNGIAPGYPNDILPAGGSIIVDNTMPANPRNPATIYYDGKDKVVSSGQIAMTQVVGEPTWLPVQSIKTNITSTYDFGQSFTIPFGEDFNSRDFRYTALFIRASENNTTVNIDKDNNGTFETTVTLNEGGSYLVNGGVLTGALVTSNKPVGVEVNAGGVDEWSIRNAPIFPATWYSNVYYTPVPTSDDAGDNPKDSSTVMLYNSLSRPITINWSSGIPSSGSINIPAKSVVRFPLAYSTTAAYKFVNPTGESFTAIEIVDSYRPGSTGTEGTTYDWSFNLISEQRLTDYATVAWAPGGLDLDNSGTPDVNGNPIWVTPNINTTIYVKYDGNISGTGGLTSPCGLKYDVSYPVNALNYIKIKDPNDNDQSGIGIYTCNGAKIAAVYGEDAEGSGTGVGVAYWDVGTTIQPFCKQKLIFAVDDYAKTLVNQPVTISNLKNDYGFLATIDPSSVSTVGLLQPKNGRVTVNTNGTVLYTPNTGFVGIDTFQYQVCSTPSPVVCDLAYVYVQITNCPSNGNENIISGQVFLDRTKDGINNDGAGFANAKVYLYTDGNCNNAIDANELTDSVNVDNSGTYQFVKNADKTVFDNFDAAGGTSSCASGSDGNTGWLTNWVDAGESGAATGFCITPAPPAANNDVEIILDGSNYALRLDDNDVSATRTINMSGATKAFLTFSYKKATALSNGENILVQMSTNGTAFTTIFTIAGNGSTDAGYVTIYNQDITSFASANTYLRFLTSSNVDEGDIVFIDNIEIRLRKYNQCYMVRLDPSSVPANHYTTTTTQRNTTFTSGGTCTSQFDFGITKNSISITGNVHHDANGLTDNLVNGPGIGRINTTPLYAYLIDQNGVVAFKSTVDISTGAFNFPIADVNTNYVLQISMNDSALFRVAPTATSYPTSWVSVGENYGTNNLAGAGNKTGAPNSKINIQTGTTNITGIKVGIEKQPDSDNKVSVIPLPNVGDYITLNGLPNPELLTGTDLEDCTTGCLLTNKSIIIDAYPTNAELYYNNVLVEDGQLINNFNPNLFQVKFTEASVGYDSTSFTYSYVDLAGQKDPTPATYIIYWPGLLTSSNIGLIGTLTNNVVNLNWETLSENNTSHFVIERSVNGKPFEQIGNTVPASGRSTVTKNYQAVDNLSGILNQQFIYYRVTLVDLSGQIRYSNVIKINLSKNDKVHSWPNPFHTLLNVSVSAQKDKKIRIQLKDAHGKVCYSQDKHIRKGNNQLVLNNLDALADAFYVMEITDLETGEKMNQKLQKIK
jgi:hypothetical protein